MQKTGWREREGREAYRVFIKEWVKVLGNGGSSPIHWQTADHILESSRKDETFTTDADPLDVGHPEGVKPPVLLVPLLVMEQITGWQRNPSTVKEAAG